MKRDERVIESAKSMLCCGGMRDNSLFYGKTVCLKETRSKGRLIYNEEARNEWGFEETSHGIVAVQLEGCTKEQLVTKGNRIAKRFSPWITIDPIER